MKKQWMVWLTAFVLAVVAATGVFMALQPSAVLAEGRGGRGGTSTAVVNGTALTQAESDGLLYMREEEKLAHDVYLALYAQWGDTTFSNIANSEAKHMDSVLNLLETYGLQDPAAGKAAGEFTNADLQALYDTLVAQGSSSLAEALRVGAAIEEIDILDLRTHLAETTYSDIRQVYTNLMNASGNHLRAFASQIALQTGEDYVPQYLSAEDYAEILSGTATGQTQGRGGSRRGR